MKSAAIGVLSLATVVALGAVRQTPPPTPPPASQTPPPAAAGQQAPVFKAAVDVVHLDVSVFDKARRPLRGLTQADFTVLEDGKPQAVSVFS